MRPSAGFVLTFICLGLMLHLSAGAGDLAIYTEESPPINFTKDGKLEGSSVAVVREILRRLNSPDKIEVLPWARGYSLLKSEPNVVLFSTTRTDEREKLFNWVGLLCTAKSGFYAKKENRLRFQSLEDIKKVRAIATYKDDAREQALKALGFSNLDSSNSPISNIKKLAAGRVDLWFSDNLTMPRVAKQVGMNPSELHLVYTFRKYDLYIAMSKSISSEILDRWRKTLDAMKRDGTFARLSLRWLPADSIPGLSNHASNPTGAPITLEIYTEDNPPGNFLADEKPGGFVVDLVREILTRLGRSDTIAVVPWARGYNMALTKPNVALFSTTRLPQREKLFRWVGPVYTQQWGFYAKKGAGVQITSMENARRVPRIGTYHNDAKEQFLLKNGFSNLISTNKNVSNVRHLIQGNIDLWVSSDFNMPYIAWQAGVDPNRLERVFAFRSVKNYIAFSMGTPPNVITDWQRTLDDIVRDGTYAEIKARHLSYDGRLKQTP